MQWAAGSERPASDAAALEAGLDDHPGERGVRLVQVGEAWCQAGEPERSLPLFTEAITFGGEVGGLARADLADVLFELDRAGEAEEQLDALWQDRPSSPAPYHVAAELLVDLEAVDAAHAWIEAAVAQLSAEQLADLRMPDPDSGELMPANPLLVLSTRWRIRDLLELPEDELDRSAVEVMGSEAISGDEAFPDAWERPEAPTEVQVLFWPRDEVARAHELWPELVDDDDAEAMLRERELDNRELSEAGYTRIEMVPLTTAQLSEYAARTGGDPNDDHVRRECMDEIVRENGVLAWPPQRNEPCWCGSTTKYKKCCGHPSINEAGGEHRPA